MQNFSIFLILALISLEANAQNLTDKISFDDSVRSGALSNGFTYYIRKNRTPCGQVSMHLVVKAGLDNEDEQQCELSHLLEHMAFAETTHFPDPYKFFQSKGLQMGREINARTQLDATSFQLKHLPANDTILTHDCLRFLRDCADGITLPPDKVAHESATVIRELYMKDSYISRAEAQYLSIVTGDPRYDFFSSIEQKEMNLKSSNYGALTSFYHTWYRPDRQGIIIAGDIDVQRVEHLVRQIFSSLKKVTGPMQAKGIGCAVELPPIKTRFTTITNPDLQEPVLKIYMKRPCKVPQTKSDYKDVVLSELYNKMMERRLYSLRQENSALTKFSHNFQDRFYARGPDFSVLFSELFIKPNRIKDAFMIFMTELERVKRYGFSDSELNEAKEELIQAEITKETISSDQIVAGLEQYFVYQTPFPSNEDRKQLLMQHITSITNADVNRKARSWIQFDNAIIVLLASKNRDEDIPTEDTVRQWLDQISKADIEPEFDNAYPAPLMTANEISQLQPSENIRRKEFEQIGVSYLLFPNGVQVYLKPTPRGSTHEVYVSAFSHGGASVYSDSDHLLAKHAATVVGNSGLGTRSPSEIAKYALSKGVSVRPSISENSENLFGRAKTKNIEELFQMIYLLFTQPGKDSSYLKKYVRRLNDSKKQTTAFTQATMQATAIASTPDFDAYIDKFTFDRMYRIFRERFRDAGDFSFVIAGDFQTDHILALLTKYLANLPSAGYRDKTPVQPPMNRKPRIVRVFREKNERKDAYVQIEYLIAQPYSATGDAKIRALAQVLQVILMQKLRRENGGTYIVAVPFGRSEGVMPNLAVSFECAPATANKMIKITRRAIKKIRSRGPDSTALKMALEIEKRKVDKSLQDPLLFSRYMVRQLNHEQNLEEITTIKSTLQSLTPHDIKELAHAYLKKSRAMQFTQLPTVRSSLP
jgi:zinc protease